MNMRRCTHAANKHAAGTYGQTSSHGASFIIAVDLVLALVYFLCVYLPYLSPA